jgi:hypothetical protein
MAVAGSGVGVAAGVSDTTVGVFPPHPTKNDRTNITAIINFSDFW